MSSHLTREQQIIAEARRRTLARPRGVVADSYAESDPETWSDAMLIAALTTAIPMAASASPPPSAPEIGGARWTTDQIEALKAELLSRHLLDPLWKKCADALGSLQFDLVDERLSAGRDAVLEEAAKVADRWSHHHRYATDEAIEHRAEQMTAAAGVAAGIRALKARAAAASPEEPRR